LRLARYILGVVAAAHIAGAQAQNATRFPSAEPFPEDTTEIEDCLEPFDALHLDAKAKGELVGTLNQGSLVQSERCRLVINYEAAQLRLINFMRENQERCRIRREYREAVNTTLAATKRLKIKTCKVRLASPAAESYLP
jgi:hypothetical protein